MATYNCGEFIGGALESLFSQTYTDYEAIIVDDGSTDDTWNELDRWASRINYYHQSNRGPSAARNFGASSATGEFLAYLDADDKWMPDKLERQVAYLQGNAKCGLVHSDVEVIDLFDQVVCQSFNRENRRPALEGKCLHELLRRSCIFMPSVMERRSCFDMAGGFDERIRYGEDYLHWLKVLLAGHDLGYIDQPLAIYRRRPGSLSDLDRSRVDVKSIVVAESMLTVYTSLRDENKTSALLDSKAKDILRVNIASLHADLSYFLRIKKCYRLARRHALSSLWSSPYMIKPYIELFKLFLPQWVLKALKAMSLT